MDIESLKFPLGKYDYNPEPASELISRWIADIENFPQQLREALAGVSTEALNWPYRPDGWNVKQVVHHCADSHINALIRFKLALTEDKPDIRPYFEDRWAKLPGNNLDDLSDTLLLLESLHRKWVFLLKSLSTADLQREYFHPEHGLTFNLAGTVGNYAWHCRHHLAHVVNGLASEGRYG